MENQPFLPKDFPSLSYTRLLHNRHRVDDVILTKARRNKQIIYGSKAMDRQLTPILREERSDYDVYSKRPRRDANDVQRQLDRVVADGHNDFYSKPALHKDTWKVMHEGKDGEKNTRDDVGIVDYTNMKRKIKTVSYNGIAYEEINSIVKRKHQILADPQSKYRHEKDKKALNIIGLSKKIEDV